jgi:hypothetical protein
MSTDTTEPKPAAAAGRRPWLVGVAALFLFGMLGTAVAYYGTQMPPAAPGSAPKKDPSVGLVTRIQLPVDDTPVPDGPHREEFRVACTVCHSPRLVFTQPHLTEKQWTAVVHKMTTKYGAPLSSEDEKRIVQYVHTVHGK